jgi:O-antigen/teichoic acid export membrane protein
MAAHISSGIRGGRLSPVALAADGARQVLGGSAVLLFVALLTMNAGNLAFHVLSSRLLGSESYGALGSLLAVLVALAVPVGALQVALTGEVARHHEAGRPIRAAALALRLTLLGVAGAAVLAASAPLLQAYLHLSSPTPVLWLAAYLVPMSAGVVPWACLCGQRRYATLAAVVLVAVAARVVAGTLLLTAGTGVTGAVAATLIGELVLASGLLLAARPRPDGASPDRLWIGRRQALGGIGALAGLSLLVSVDSVLARHYLPPAEAGRYVAGLMLARGALFLCQAATSVALPMLASAHPGRAAAALRRTLLLAGALGLATTGVLALAAGSLLPAVFGPGFDASPALMLLLGLASSAAGLVAVLIQRDIAQRLAGATAAWAGVAALVVLTALLHDEPAAIAAASLGAGSLALVVALAGAGRRERRTPRPAMRRPDAPARAELDLTVVVPFYNPGSGLRDNLHRLLDVLDDAEVGYEVIAVDDGCSDGSGTTIDDLADRRVRLLTFDRNRGKGEALRAGLRAGRGRYLGFIDADGDIDPRLWGPFLALMRTHRPDALIGSKRHPQSVYEMKPTRLLCSFGYQRLTRLLFGLPVRDTQVGIKLFRRELLLDALPRTVERGFVFDVELLAVARRLGYRRLMEAPVVLRHGERSTIRVSTVATMLRQTVAVAWRLHVAGSYGAPAAETAPRTVPALAPAPAPAPAAAAGLARSLSGAVA